MLTVTVRWSEGEVTQELAPVYIQTQPNGPQCEPTCSSARVEVRIPRVPAYGDPSTWATYADDRYGFHFKYPPALKLEVRPEANEYRTVFVGDQVRVRTAADDPLACRGECPMIESSEVVRLAGRQAHQLRGIIGSIGGNVPQQFIMYLIRLNETYVSFELYAEGRYATTDDPSVIKQLTEQDTELFGRIMQTVKFET
jgi:hypothetical protein